eukprot:TRINITY_DN647_c0_g1_i1.p2 TRINITY_DN647_c0_g1~~TRINITY_DN647_c0_g1_i1.p2  ORF type:complete len:427 (+),score=60.20 TRINITY_DN647_c0_g1_i1:94-1374(+)
MVLVSAPTQEEIVQQPRAFALYSLLSKNGDIGQQELQDLAEKMGVSDKVNGKSEISFQELATIFDKPSQGDKAQGNCIGYAAFDNSSPLRPYVFNRDELEKDYVSISILYAGICHSDVHQVKDEWENAKYPFVPGHEIVGVITDVGENVSEWKQGDIVGVGCMVACKCELQCENCKKDEEQYCLKGKVDTYNGIDVKGNVTHGGYSTHILCHKHFVCKMPTNIDLAAATPLLCAGITVYSPMKYYGLDKPGMHIGVMGLGGLGHVAVKFGKAFGCKVTVLSTSENKKEEALNKLGADAFLITKDENAVKEAARTMDGIIDTVSAYHDVLNFLSLLKTDGKWVMVGAPAEPFSIKAMPLLVHRITIGGSLIGGIKETQDMLDFCGEKNIVCDIETINIDYVNTAYERMLKNDIKYRFVIDIASSLVF